MTKFDKLSTVYQDQFNKFLTPSTLLNPNLNFEEILIEDEIIDGKMILIQKMQEFWTSSKEIGVRSQKEELDLQMYFLNKNKLKPSFTADNELEDYITSRDDTTKKYF